MVFIPLERFFKLLYYEATSNVFTLQGTMASGDSLPVTVSQFKPVWVLIIPSDSSAAASVTAVSAGTTPTSSSTSDSSSDGTTTVIIVVCTVGGLMIIGVIVLKLFSYWKVLNKGRTTNNISSASKQSLPNNSYSTSTDNKQDTNTKRFV